MSKPKQILLFIKHMCICMFFWSVITYVTTKQEIAALDFERLENLYKSIQLNTYVTDKICSVDVSYPVFQYDIASIRFFYGFDYDVAKTLYQYHKYHNIPFGSINDLIEYENLSHSKELSKVVDSDDETQKEIQFLYSEQVLRVVLIIVLGYWSVCFFNNPPSF